MEGGLAVWWYVIGAGVLLFLCWLLYLATEDEDEED